MSGFAVFLYGVCFAAIAGAAFALMWVNMRDIYTDKPAVKRRHPEAPEPGDEVMYVDFSREKLEQLYNNGTTDRQKNV